LKRSDSKSNLRDAKLSSATGLKRSESRSNLRD
jgi:hypothetical protein